MATASLHPYVALDTYLTTVYEPDVDYVDGELEDRHVGEYDHNMIQRAVLFWFYMREKEWRIRAIQEQRTRLARTRVRIPDISIFTRDTSIEQVFTSPQLIAIEVLSPEDRHSRMDKKISDYMQFGVPHIWIIDSATRQGWNCSHGDWVQADHFQIENSPIYLSLPELFADMDARNS